MKINESPKYQCPDVLITNGDMTADIISTSVSGFTIKIGQIFNLKDAPNIRQLALLGGIKADKWYCPMQVSHHSGKEGAAIVFFSPPYDNVSIGFAWIKSDWTQAEVLDKSLDEPVREGLNALLLVRNTCGGFRDSKASTASDMARLELAKEKRKKKAAKYAFNGNVYSEEEEIA